MTYILVINGSPTNGTTDKLFIEVKKGIESEACEVKELILRDTNLPLFHGEYKTEIPVEMKESLELVMGADGIIFCTPTHWFNMSVLMKNFIDWLTILELDDFKMEGKVVGVVTNCEEDGGQASASLITAPLLHMGCMIPPYGTFFYNKNMADKSEHNWMNEGPAIVGSNVVKMIHASKLEKIDWGY